MARVRSTLCDHQWAHVSAISLPTGIGRSSGPGCCWGFLVGLGTLLLCRYRGEYSNPGCVFSSTCFYLRARRDPVLLLVNLNTATTDELETLPKIGTVLAQRIVDYRERHGPFQRVDQIMAVERVGPSVYEAIRHLVTVGD